MKIESARINEGAKHTGSATPPLIDIRNLSIAFSGSSQRAEVVRQASMTIQRGEIHGLVGESGSGKTLLARSILGLLPQGAAITGGEIRFSGQDLVGLQENMLRRFRGAAIGMVFQEPMMSLNPALKIGRQMAEAMALHTDLDQREIRRQCIEMLERVRMPDPERCLDAYPHEFSGGMRQRIMLASVLMMRPSLLLADEPTTALDVLIQKEILEIMVEVVRDLQTAVLLITHDLGLVATYARRVSVMKQGQIVEQGDLNDTLMQPRHEYTRQLLRALPARDDGESAADGQRGKPIVEVKDLRVTFGKHGLFPWQRARQVNALNGISFSIARNETVAVVGESGSGKTTLGRAMLRLVEKSAGSVIVDGRDFHRVSGKAERELRRRLQIVFQDPYSSLDPRQRIGGIVAEGLRLVPGLDRDRRREKVKNTLREVGIDPDWVDRYPHELSGGQRQRIGIARAIITEPMLIVADEAVSALDLTVQAQVLALLKKLQRRMHFSCLFISHDLGVVEQLADRIIVMYRGRIVEMGSRSDIFDRPRHPYTRALLGAVPELIAVGDNSYRLAERNLAESMQPVDQSPDSWSRGGDQSGHRELVEIEAGHLVAVDT